MAARYTIAAMLFLTIAASYQAEPLQRVSVQVIGCDDCVAHPLGVSVWDTGQDLPITPIVSQRTAERFVLAIPAGYYQVDVTTKTCNGDRFLGVLPRRDRFFELPTRCIRPSTAKGKPQVIGSVRVVDGAHGLAGSLPRPIRAMSIWSADGGSAPIAATISHGAYYVDELNCNRCVLALTLPDGTTAKVAMVLHDSSNFSLFRRDLTVDQIGAGKSISGSPFFTPGELIEGPHKTIWALDRLGNRVIVIYGPRSARKFDLPDPYSNPGSIVATENFVWVTERNPAKIVRFDVGGKSVEYSIGDFAGYYYYCALAMIADSEHVWYVCHDRLISIDERGLRKEYVVPSPVAYLEDVTTRSDGSIWVLGTASSQTYTYFIAARGPDGTWDRFTLSDDATALSLEARILPASSGFWIDYGHDLLAFVDMQGREKIARFPVSSMGVRLYAVDKSDHAWFTDRYGNMLGEAKPDGSTTLAYPEYNPPAISDMRFDSNGSLWIAEPRAHIVTEYNKGVALPPPGLRPKNLLFDSQGVLWYSDPDAGVVGTISRKGRSICFVGRHSTVKNCQFGRADIVP